MKERKQTIVSGAIMILVIGININWAVTSGTSIGIALITSLCNWLCLMSYLIVGRYPLIALIGQLINQLLLIVTDLIGGESVIGAVNNTGTIEIICMLSVAVFAVYFYKDNKKNIKGFSKKKLVEKAKSVVTYKRSPIEIPIWAIFCIWCIIIALILGTSNDSAFNEFKLKYEYKIFAAAALVMPTMVTLAISTTSNMIYSLLIAQQVIKFITMYEMAVRRELQISSLSYVLLETLVVAVATIEYVRNKPKRERKAREKEDEQKEFVSTLGIDYTDEEISDTVDKK